MRQELDVILSSRRASKLPTSPLRDAARACNVEYRWLLERVQRKEIPAYRPDAGSSWRVYLSDVDAFLTKTSNLEITPDKRAQKKLKKLCTT